MVYAHDSKSCGRKAVWVQIPPWAPISDFRKIDRFFGGVAREFRISGAQGRGGRGFY